MSEDKTSQLSRRKFLGGVEPASVDTCQGRARIFGDFNDPESQVSKLVKEHNLTRANNTLRDEEGTRPQVFYIDPDNVMNTIYIKRKNCRLDHYVGLIS